ncbi:transmembrane protein, putative [Medicago truncatula]|uniref:Transmembrane protein, putative n=1 Tax=Medicago truncatula TaxID=3880 RepID=G7KG26_MEDTR|nr:transmembrane protein, putative [Medicago truncatula]
MSLLTVPGHLLLAVLPPSLMACSLISNREIDLAEKETEERKKNAPKCNWIKKLFFFFVCIYIIISVIGCWAAGRLPRVSQFGGPKAVLRAPDT